MSEYENVQKGSLKLKGVQSGGIKKKKKKKRDKDKDEKVASSLQEDGEISNFKVEKKTRAELAFERAQDRMKAEQILDRAKKTHKERITEFNKQLDELTEHFDIPKVSWTK